MRAFRPSRFGALEEKGDDPVEAIIRSVKVRVYAKRAQAHRPLFQEKARRPSEVIRRED